MTFDPLTLRRAFTEYLGKLGPLATGMKGTDLGVSFERDGKLVFRFGDSLTAGGALQDVDLAATTELAFPAAGIRSFRGSARSLRPGSRWA